MIDIINKEDCVGCHACVQRCPKCCICMEEDEQGFLYPKIDLARCIGCNLCEKVCPVINQSESIIPQAVYAAKNNDERVQACSSSGGVFHALAANIISEGGVVFGALFNERWEVEHAYAENMKDLKAFQTSKYVQSKIGDTFQQAETFLKSGRKVMFTGTPCQIAGLRRFLGRDYGSRLLLVDVVCHGVPSPRIWREYLNDCVEQNGFKMSDIKEINFRDKRNGWNRYGLKMFFKRGNRYFEYFSPMKDNLYMQGFLRDLYLRPSCYACPSKCGKSHSDITLADFWGIGRMYPHYYREGCHSLLLVQTLQGREMLWNLRDITIHEVSCKTALKENPSVVRSSDRPKQYDRFWQEYSCKGISAVSNTVEFMRPALPKRFYDMFRSFFVQLFSRLTA